MAGGPLREWTQLLGSSSDDYAYSVSTAADGSIYIAGSTSGSLDGQVNSGKSDAFVSKYNSDGSKAWTRLLGTTGDEYAYSVSTASDGSVYIVGETFGTGLDGQTRRGSCDAFISKYKSDGSKEWTRHLGSDSSDSARSVATASDGSIYIVGETQGNLDGQSNNGTWDAFLSKYNSDGSKAWTRLLGSTSSDYAYSVSTGIDESIYITGKTKGTIDGQSVAGMTMLFLPNATAMVLRSGLNS